MNWCGRKTKQPNECGGLQQSERSWPSNRKGWGEFANQICMGGSYPASVIAGLKQRPWGKPQRVILFTTELITIALKPV